MSRYRVGGSTPSRWRNWWDAIRVACWEHGPDRVSPAWLEEQYRREVEQSVQVDGPCWSWPVRKMANESASFNGRRLRKRA